MFKLICIVNFLLTFVHSQNDNSSSDVNVYLVYNGCPDGTFYSDVAGTYIRCEANPWIGSKHEICWRDLWWKTYPDGDAKSAGISNPFHVLDAQGCRATCFCKMTIDISKFTCMDKGAELGWNRFPPKYAKYTPILRCMDFGLPSIFDTLQKSNLELVLSFQNVPITSNQLNIDLDLYHNLARSISQRTFPIGGLIINTIPISGGDTFNLAKSFLTNISYNNLHRLDILNQINDRDVINFPDLESIFNTLPNSLEFLTLHGWNINSLPDTINPPFLDSLKSILIKNIPTFRNIPAWVSNARNLVYLKLDNVAKNFNWDSLMNLVHLKYLSLTNIAIFNFPSQFNVPKICPNLEYLDISNLNISSFPKDFLSGLTNLRFLDISGNQLSTLPSFTGLNQLRWLGISGISQSSDRKCTYGMTRRLSLTKTDLADLSNLITLDVSNYESVNIADDAFDTLVNLQIFKATCSGLVQIPAALKTCCRLRELRVDRNRLNGTDSIPSFLATELIELLIFDWRYNEISILPQTMLSFSSTNYQLIDWLIISLKKNPAYNNPCETRRLEIAYSLISIRGDQTIGNGSNADQQQCNAGDIGKTAVATSRVCQPSDKKRTPTILLACGVTEKTSIIMLIITIALIIDF